MKCNATVLQQTIRAFTPLTILLYNIPLDNNFFKGKLEKIIENIEFIICKHSTFTQRLMDRLIKIIL